MKSVEVFLVNAFTHNGHGGNPAGVVLSAANLTDEEKLFIAKSVGYSETAFVSEDPDTDFRVSFYTTTGEVDFCGHATLATFSTLFRQGVVTAGVYKQHTNAGLLPVTVHSDGSIIMEQALPQYLATFTREQISPLIGLSTDILASTGLPIEVVSTGLPDIIVPVPVGYLDKIRLDDKATSEFCKQHQVVGIHAFELNKHKNLSTARCRNFAPLFAIPEESATGSASGALACYLVKQFGNHKRNFVFEQGRLMGATSQITAELEYKDNQMVRVLVGGKAGEIGVRQIYL